MADGQVVIERYDPQWTRLFRTAASDLRMALGAVALRIDHVGSTSVPGLDAKPAIDVQVSVSALDPSASFLEPLVALGYRYRADNPNRTTRVLPRARGPFTPAPARP